MKAGSDATPDSLDTAGLIDNYDLHFDPGDKRNGSLYLCAARDDGHIAAPLAMLRDQGLWSSQEKTVADDQRQAYKDGLEFVAAVAYRDGAQHFVLGRFDHPKFPSDGERWTQWLECMDKAYERIV